jgi:hypothetical protein
MIQSFDQIYLVIVAIEIQEFEIRVLQRHEFAPERAASICVDHRRKKVPTSQLTLQVKQNNQWSTLS